MTPSTRLKLVPTDTDAGDAARLDVRLGNALEAIFQARGFSETRKAVEAEVGRLAAARMRS